MGEMIAKTKGPRMREPIETWWEELPAAVRVELSVDPRGPLSPEAIQAIINVTHIGPAGASFNGEPPTFHLTPAEAEWIEQRDDEDLADDAEQHAMDMLDDAFKGFPTEI